MQGASAALVVPQHVTVTILLAVWMCRYTSFWCRYNLYQGICDCGFGGSSKLVGCSFFFFAVRMRIFSFSRCFILVTCSFCRLFFFGGTGDFIEAVAAYSSASALSCGVLRHAGKKKPTGVQFVVVNSKFIRKQTSAVRIVYFEVLYVAGCKERWKYQRWLAVWSRGREIERGAR